MLRYPFFFFFLFFIKYADASYIGGPSNADNNEGAKKIKKVLSDVKLKADAEGYPILPSWETIKDDGLLGKKLLIGKFLSEIQRAYHLFALSSIKPLIYYHQRLPSVVERGESPGRTCNKFKMTIFFLSICQPGLLFNSTTGSTFQMLMHSLNIGRQGKLLGRYHSASRNPSRYLGILCPSPLKKAPVRVKITSGRHRNRRKIVGALT